ncbi:MaoC family dehydratase N-terminal domain-containing protein [Dehalococcoidia bacterium]|nr:MaoC family dehydratase N-terminal domain-containing protein [Dehalococcoidia bacterium]
MTFGDTQIKYDHSMLGVEYDVGPFPVTREMIVEFALSTGEIDPRYLDEVPAPNPEHCEIIAPPTFCNVFSLGVERPDIKLDFGDLSFFAGQSIECLAPVSPGDTIHGTTKLKTVYPKTGRSGMMVFAVWQTSLMNQAGEVVALIEESYVLRNRGKE